MRRALLPLGALVGTLVAIQALASAAGCDFYLTQGTMAAYYAVVVLGLCLVMGYAGQVSLGHGAFFALGGYTSAILTTTTLAPLRDAAWAGWLQRAGLLAARRDAYGAALLTVSPPAAFAAALLVTLLVAALIGYPALRLRGHYLAMATLGFGLIVYRLLLGSAMTGAADGITGVPPLSFGAVLSVTGDRAHRIQNYYLAWGFATLTLVALLNLVRSRIGRALRALHDGDVAADAMGIDTARLKFQAFLLSAGLAAAAGSLLTHFNGGIGPSEASPLQSIRYVALVAAGGMANLWGALIVSAVLTFLSLRGYFGSYDHLVFGAILIAIIALAPEGPLQPIAAGVRRVMARGAPRRPAA